MESIMPAGAMSTISSTSIAATALTLVVSYKLIRSCSREQGLPPGPPTVPLLGNILQITTKDMYLRFTEWSREFGEIYSLKIGPSTVIVLSSPSSIKDVLDRQSAYTSDRPEHTLSELVTDGWNLFLSRYNDRWRRMRKAAQMLLAPSVVKDYLPIQDAESTQLLFDVLSTPDKFFTHMNRYSNSIALSIIYGKRSPRMETPTAAAIVEITERWNAFMEPGATPPLDIYPMLKWIPNFMAPWMNRAHEIRNMQRTLYLDLFDECHKRVEAGDGAFFMGDVIRDQKDHGLNRKQMSALAGSIYEAGSETGATVMHNLILLLAAHPDVQTRLQAEIDGVVGAGRLPEHKDSEHMPFLRAVLQEAHRFRTVAPISLPHRATKDLHYKEYLVPEGATLLGNLYALYHDPDLFEDPFTFNPNRYLDNEYGTKPGVDTCDFRTTLNFGFGRRICPGMHLADVSAVLGAMKLFWAFTFRPPTDPVTGEIVPLDVLKNRDGIAAGPPPFKCDIHCRSPARAEIIRHAFKVDAAQTLSLYEFNLSQADKAWLESVRAA
ncbi:cytochrome P450 [Schizophyllum fasciatum]